MAQYQLIVNGKTRSADAEPDTPLLILTHTASSAFWRSNVEATR
jgi:hypothetical protein